jgi:hypothetical protein
MPASAAHACDASSVRVQGCAPAWPFFGPQRNGSFALEVPLFGTKPQRIVVREYGRDSMVFAAVNPLMTSLMVNVLGMKNPSGSADRIALAMEKDAVKMAERGYRIVSTHEYEQPRLGISYYKVTYELVDSAKVEPPK